MDYIFFMRPKFEHPEIGCVWNFRAVRCFTALRSDRHGGRGVQVQRAVRCWRAANYGCHYTAKCHTICDVDCIFQIMCTVYIVLGYKYTNIITYIFFIHIIYIYILNMYICSHWSTPRTCFLHHLQVECCRIFAAKYWDVARDNQNFTARTEGESHGVLVADGWWWMRFEQGSWKLYFWVVK